MKQYFKLREFIFNERHPLPLHVADKIVDHHLLPMNDIRNRAFHSPIFVSMKSGYRSDIHERSKGRRGSAHEFRDNPDYGDNGWGAVDYRTSPALFPNFIRVMIKESPYHRIAFYPEANNPFIHCDYKHMDSSDKSYFVVMEGKWVQGSVSDLINAVDNIFEQK